MQPSIEQPSKGSAPVLAHPEPVEWADRVFVEFRRLFPSRPMVQAFALELRHAPDLGRLRQRMEQITREASRLRCAVDTSARAPRWIERDFTVDAHVFEVVDRAVRGMDDLLRPQAPREGGHLDWNRPPWALEVIRNHEDPSVATFHAIRVCWDHTLTDMEGMYLILIRLGNSTDLAPLAPSGPRIEKRWSRLRRLRRWLARCSASALHATAGSREVTWTHVPLGATVSVVGAMATRRGVEVRDVLIALSAKTYHSYRQSVGESPIRFAILSPSYSTRFLDGRFHVGNQHRLATWVMVPTGCADLDAYIDSIGTQVGDAQPTSYRGYRALGQLPDKSARRVISRMMAPVIVNWDAPRLAERLLDIAGAEVGGVSVATPLLPHQQCSFIWWVRDATLHCSLSTDAALIAEPETLAACLRQTMDSLSAMVRSSPDAVAEPVIMRHGGDSMARSQH